MIDYAFIALCLVGFAIFMYVILDGFGLGVGILFPLMSESEQVILLKTIAPIWDGNETWLVLGGALLYAAFPQACSIILPAIYMPLMLMLCALVGRGVAFEFRAKAERTKARWARCFFLSSLVATFCQGVILGTLVEASANSIDLAKHTGLLILSPFVFICGLGLCFGYALLGSGWLIIKTEGELEKKVRRFCISLYMSVMIILVAIMIITPLKLPAVAKLWFEYELWTKFSIIILYSSGIFVAFWKTLKNSQFWPFFGAVWTYFGCFLMIGYSFFPNLLPNRSYQSLAAHETALTVVVWASLTLLPLLLSYCAYAYWVFWGKVDHETSFYE
jgi:cytochrome d ubiquinol oxidase subunit II